MSWITWASALAFVDILLILIVVSFGASGYDVGDADYNKTINEFNSSSTVDWVEMNWFDKLSVSFSVLPWWFNFMFVTFNIVLIGILIAAFVRGFS